MRGHFLIASALLVALTPLGYAQTRPATRPATSGPAAVVPLHGVIDPYMYRYIEDRFAEAKQAGARTIIIDLDTPGGQVDAAQNLARLIRGQKDVRTIAYVNPSAYSAGALVATAADEIVMAPGSQMGASSVIHIDQQGQIQSLPDDVRKKLQSPIIEEYRENARQRHYDPLLLEAMVEAGVVVHWMQSPAGERRFVDQAGYDKLSKQGWTAVPDLDDPIDGPNTVLTVSSYRALKLGLATEEVSTVDELARQRGIQIAVRYEPASPWLLTLLSNPWMRGVMLCVFLVAIFIAAHAPGHGTAELIALAALAGLTIVPLITGYAQWWEVAIIFLGMVLLAIELFLIPGFGVTGVAGLVLMIVGFILTFVPREPGGAPGLLPTLPSTWAALRTGVLIVVLGMASALALSMWLRRFLPKLPYFSRLILTTTVGQSEDGSSAPSAIPADQAPVWPPVGTIGKAMTELKPGGSAEFPDGADTRVISVVSDGGYIEPGTTIAVRLVEGTRVVVRKATHA